MTAGLPDPAHLSLTGSQILRKHYNPCLLTREKCQTTVQRQTMPRMSSQTKPHLLGFDQHSPSCPESAPEDIG